ncbi:MAG: exo-alpha-sialidase, partial [Victivallales bacterium]|nr:exo-alpha-sialidase [Victivallales bacterium]
IREITMPDENAYYSCGNGSGQSIELENGDLLIPVYYMSKEEAGNPWDSKSHAMIMRCSFDGREIRILELGNSVTIPVPRGADEPSIIRFKDKFFVAIRNDHDGYVSYSSDGLQLEEPIPLAFDDGSSVGNYNTQQHWLTCGGKLYMVYTRKNAGNDHVFRHRAPLFMAEFDTEKLCIIRATEQIAVPERGARLGNFGCFNVSDNEAWIIASEWMQTNPPNPFDWTVCAKYGSDNSIFIAKVTCDEE